MLLKKLFPIFFEKKWKTARFSGDRTGRPVKTRVMLPVLAVLSSGYAITICYNPTIDNQ